ncbi:MULTISPECIES: cupin [unclassified Mycobacterium]|uniref:cupin n=1 Tax=unclassified Mycobacterium TaxID=2642494 RepID=UPI0029C7F472|nr:MULTISPECIES: cupin [unclassified Mycobacterium]
MNGLRAFATTVATVMMLAAGSVATAGATPGIDVQSEILSQATSDGQDFVTKEITIAPGGSTGWHWHAGRVYGVIREGELTHYAADCSVDGVYPTGSPVTEATGPNHVHLGRNLGPDPLVMWISYIEPAGGPLATDVPNPGCDFE